MRNASVAAMLLATLAPPAGAADFLAGASYGDKEGCHYATTGESSGADVFFLLTAESITTAASVCTILGPAEKAGKSFRVKIQCEAEDGVGEKETVTLEPSRDAYTVRFADGNRWGPLKRCGK